MINFNNTYNFSVGCDKKAMHLVKEEIIDEVLSYLGTDRKNKAALLTLGETLSNSLDACQSDDLNENGYLNNGVQVDNYKIHVSATKFSDNSAIIHVSDNGAGVNAHGTDGKSHDRTMFFGRRGFGTDAIIEHSDNVKTNITEKGAEVSFLLP